MGQDAGLGWGLTAMVYGIVAWVVLAIYFIPALVAKRRNHPNVQAIFVLNLLLGWSLIGWALALTWAVTVQNQQASS